MIKNVFFCVAKTQVDNPGGKFFLTLLGTDRLEEAFGNLCTTIGNDTNADLLQIGSQLTSASECSIILASHSEWDHGPCQLRICSLDEDASINPDIDHLSPQHWIGDLHVEGISLITCWRMGAATASKIFENARMTCNFTQLVEDGTIDIFAPLGKLVFKDGLQPGEEHEELELLLVC
jgi:hypothetical protein